MLKSRTSGDAVAAMLVLFEASFRFWLSSIRIPGASNGKADDLSRDRLANFKVLNPGATVPSAGMNLSKLDSAVQYFCYKGLAESTHKTYQSAIKKFGIFCSSPPSPYLNQYSATLLLI